MRPSREGAGRFAGILHAQLPDPEKRRRADFVVVTALSRRATLRQLGAIVERLRHGRLPRRAERLRRLAGVPHPTRVVWGASDGIADPGYGRAYAAVIPGATFEVLPATGHLPHVERPDLLPAGSTLAACWLHAAA